MSESKQPLMVRMDNNITLNGIDFIKSFKDDGSTIFDIVIFSGLNQQKNLFGLEEFDLHEFCNTMGYQHRNLTKKHPDPKWVKDPKGVDMEFTNMFENALFRMATETLTFSKKVENKSQGMEGVRMKNYLLIDELNKYSFNRKNKFKYEYKLNPVLKDHMNTFFSDIDLESIVSLRKPKAVFLYLVLLNLRDQYFDNKISEVTPYFNFLVEQAQINAENNAKKKQALKEKFNIIKERSSLKFDYEFIQNKGKHKYGIKIYFSKNENYKKVKNSVLEDAFKDALMIDLISIFREIHQPTGKLNKSNFNKWLADPGSDKEAKLNSYMANKMLIKKITAKEANKHCYYEARKFFNMRIDL